MKRPIRGSGQAAQSFGQVSVLRRVRLFWLLAVVGFSTGTSSAQAPAGIDEGVTAVPRPVAPGKRPPDIRIDVNVVLIPVTVTDNLGNSVPGLPPDAFRVLEDGIEQPIAHVVMQDAPLSVGFVFDSSKSMENKIDRSREGIADILRTSIPGDEYFLVGFNDRARLLCGFTTEPKKIEDALMSVKPIGWTALLDAIQLSLSQIKRAKNLRRALVVLSDGGDNNSRFSQREIRDLLRESDVSLFAIDILGPTVPAAATRLLSNLAEETGGRLFRVHNVNQLPEAVEKLNSALRDQYVLAYYPKNSVRDGKYRRVQVRLVTAPNLPSLRASWRAGYYAPY